MTAPWSRAMASLAALAMLGGFVATGQQTQTEQKQVIPSTTPRSHSVLFTVGNRLPDANDQMENREHQTATKDYAAANLERKKQIADASATLVKLAADLKAEVDKSSKDTLSLSVIRKADEIEKLARAVKEKMKLTVAAN